MRGRGGILVGETVGDGLSCCWKVGSPLLLVVDELGRWKLFSFDGSSNDGSFGSSDLGSMP